MPDTLATHLARHLARICDGDRNGWIRSQQTVAGMEAMGRYLTCVEEHPADCDGRHVGGTRPGE